MMTTRTSRFTQLIKSFALLMMFSFVVTAPVAHAEFIDFDDLTYVPEDPEWPFFADTPVTDQYASKGLLVSDGYLLPYWSDTDPNFVSGPNYLQGGNYLQLSFVGQLPTHVGMYVSSFVQEAIFLEAYGSSGLLEAKRTGGEAGPFQTTPYTAKQYVTFDSAAGISNIQLWGYYNSRVSAVVDDLTFTYAQAEVPEPSPFILLVMGIAALGYRRLRIRKQDFFKRSRCR